MVAFLKAYLCALLGHALFRCIKSVMGSTSRRTWFSFLFCCPYVAYQMNKKIVKEKLSCSSLLAMMAVVLAHQLGRCTNVWWHYCNDCLYDCSIRILMERIRLVCGFFACGALFCHSLYKWVAQSGVLGYPANRRNL